MHVLWYRSFKTPLGTFNLMSISSLNSNLLGQNFGQSNVQTTNANLQSLGSALSGGDLVGAKNIFATLSQNTSTSSADPTTQTLMGQLGTAIHGGNVAQAQEITNALQTLQTQASTSDPLLGGANSGALSSGLNDSLFSALSLTGINSPNATTLAGISSPSAAGLISPAQEIAQNMDTFLNNLLTKLQSQSASSTSTASSANSSGASKQNPYGPPSSNQMSSGLQSLIEQLARNPNAASELNTNVASGGAAANTSSSSHDPQVSELQSSYDKLISSQGGSGGTSSLISFLQNFETNMKNMQSSGGFLNIQA